MRAMQRQTILLVCGAVAVVAALLWSNDSARRHSAPVHPSGGGRAGANGARGQTGVQSRLTFFPSATTDTPVAARQAVDDVQAATPVAVARAGAGAQLPDPGSRHNAGGAAMPGSAKRDMIGNASTDGARTGAGATTAVRGSAPKTTGTGLRRIATGTAGEARDVRPGTTSSKADAAAVSAGPFAPGSRTAPASVIGNLAILGTPMPLDQETQPSTVDASVAGDGAAPADAPREVVVTPLHVRFSAKSDIAGTASIVINVTADAAASYTPNGVVIAQTIPAGWDVVHSEPAVQSFDSGTRLAKWLFTGRAVPTARVVLSLKGADTARLEDVSAARAWYSYRQQNGKVIQRDVVLKSGADTPDT
jgi:hypothetical protein